MNKMGVGLSPAYQWSRCCLCRVLCWLQYLGSVLGGWVARTVWMPQELEWISESLHPLLLGLCDHPTATGWVSTGWTGSDTEEGMGVETRGSFLQPWPLWWLCCKVSLMRVGPCFWVHHPLWGLGESPWPMVYIVQVEVITLSALSLLGLSKERQKGV